MKTFEIYLSDLTEEARARFIEMYGDDGNYDLIPMASLEWEEEE